MSRLILGFVSAALLAACGGGSSDPDATAGTDTVVVDGRAGADALVTTDAVGRVVDFDFEGEVLPASVTPGTGVLTPSQDFAPLGPVGNTFGDAFLRSTTGNTVTLFSDLPAHSAISLAFLFAAIDSLDGSGTFPAGDFMRIDVDGTTVFRESFANATPEQIQSYVPPVGGELARRVDLGFSGPGGYYTDSAYDMGVDPAFQGIAHTASSVTITFQLEGEGVQSLDDESWAIDNLRLTLTP